MPLEVRNYLHAMARKLHLEPSEKDEIISENYKINENQKIGIIPPIGGG